MIIITAHLAKAYQRPSTQLNQVSQEEGGLFKAKAMNANGGKEVNAERDILEHPGAGHRWPDILELATAGHLKDGPIFVSERTSESITIMSCSWQRLRVGNV